MGLLPVVSHLTGRSSEQLARGNAADTTVGCAVDGHVAGRISNFLRVDVRPALAGGWDERAPVVPGGYEELDQV